MTEEQLNMNWRRLYDALLATFCVLAIVGIAISLIIGVLLLVSTMPYWAQVLFLFIGVFVILLLAIYFTI